MAQMGVPEEMLKEWTVDPQVTYPFGDKASGSLFDALEDLDAPVCLEKCADLATTNRKKKAKKGIKHGLSQKPLNATRNKGELDEASHSLLNSSVLMVLTSHDKLGETEEQTGWYLPEVAHPYHEFTKAGYDITFASPLGGIAPVDIGSVDASVDDPICMSFIAQGSVTKALVDNTCALASIKSGDLCAYDAVFFAGGFGTVWDFPDNKDVQRIARDMWEADKVVSAVCHGPIALAKVMLSDGTPLVAGKQVAAFTNDEEDAVERRKVVPVTCEDALVANGAVYTKKGVFQAHVAEAGKLITGQVRRCFVPARRDRYTW